MKNTESNQFLRGVKVYFVREGIHVASRRIKLWTEKVTQNGGKIAQEPSSQGVTHVLLEDNCIPPGVQLPEGQPLVSVAWLEACLAQQRLLPVSKSFTFDSVSERAQHGAPSALEPGPMRRYQHWLGYWKPEFDLLTNVIEFVLQAKYSERDSLNEALVGPLTELQNFEIAIQKEHEDDGFGVDIINHKALQYARAATMCRGCAFKIGPGLEDNELPFCGPSSAGIIRDLVSTGTCHELEAFRAGELVYNRGGEPRPDTLGARERRLFRKLPDVGVVTAKAWWDAGFRTYEDVELHAEQHNAEGNRSLITRSQRFSLSHRADLLEPCPPEDIEEMKAVTLATLAEMTGAPWEMWLVGGSRRSTACHDADFIISHPTIPQEGLIAALAQRLQVEGRLVPESQGMRRVWQGLMPHHLDRLRSRDDDTTAKTNNLQADRYDKLLGIYITKGGKVRRMDIILAPSEELQMCLIAWTGSKQYLRFLRQHAINRGMSLSAHRLMRPGRRENLWLIVPDEAKPLNREKEEFWPPDWDDNSRRRIATERAAFQLLEVPYREPWERNCP